MPNSDRRYALQSANALRKSWLQLSMQPSTGDGGTCSGDSGGPHFPGDETSKLVVSITVTGDRFCRATDTTYRLDTPWARVSRRIHDAAIVTWSAGPRLLCDAQSATTRPRSAGLPSRPATGVSRTTATSGTVGRTHGAPAGGGPRAQSQGMFWLSRNMFVGSYARFSALSRSYLSVPYASLTRFCPSSIRKLT